MEQKKQRMIDELPFWHGQILTIFLSFSLKNTKRKKNNITINDRIIDMKKILFLIANKIFEKCKKRFKINISSNKINNNNFKYL